jgi:two-component system chemotaxis response regulator CheB
MIRVLIVDDSKVVQDFLYHLLSSDSDIQIVGVANSGFEAIELAKEIEPDVITMDIHMQGMDGFEATRNIMKSAPTPIVIVSGSPTIKEEANIFRSLEAGALAVVQRPPGLENPDFIKSRDELIHIVKTMSKVKITRLFPQKRKYQEERFQLVKPMDNYLKRIRVIAIGADIGGPLALQKILAGLPSELPVPVLIVQHMAAGFTSAFAEWLSITSGIKIKKAVNGETLSPGIAYVAPDHFHMGISQGDKIELIDKSSDIRHKPSINWLFHSVAKVFGPHAFGVLLSGEGHDGVEALKILKEKGALTVVQNEESSVVFDLPGEALRVGAADLSLSPDAISEILSRAGSKK